MRERVALFEGKAALCRSGPRRCRIGSEGAASRGYDVSDAVDGPHGLERKPGPALLAGLSTIHYTSKRCCVMHDLPGISNATDGSFAMSILQCRARRRMA